ncbi:pyridoxal 5'-phosphate synthase glutaminase subunit PdxT [Candidatus Saccharibacteria bacterium]|jgi:5'-phosphate synthase pdxT subunit|nr:pyridoxal 5'-phosphate synthase glutaminase subunit PdxT [Candidatus Saccharibacteria bacterium]
MTVGVLALQGAFKEHIDKFNSINYDKFNSINYKTIEIRNLADLSKIDALVIPGGESTVIGMQLETAGMLEPIKKMISDGMPTWGTCAGLILLSDAVDNQSATSQKLLGGLPIKVVRNYYGRQNESFIGEISIVDSKEPQQQVFIRAPFIESFDEAVNVLANINYRELCSPVAVQYKNMLATTFHPELSNTDYWHKIFIAI